jgi:anti-sigma factor RsiW
MSDNSRNQESDEDAVLNELIRACREKERPKEFVRPDDDAITAYLMGTADEEQRKVVRSALTRSKEFRREILNMAQDMDALAELDLASYEKEAEQIPVPDLQEFVKPIPVSTEPVSFWIRLKEFGGKLIELRIPQLYAPALASAAILAFVILQTGVFAPDKTWSLVNENME